MERNALEATEDQEPVGEVDSAPELSTSDGAFLEVCELVNRGDDKAANDAFYEFYQHICELLSKVDYEATGDSLGEDLSDISELRSRLRKGLVRGLTALIGFMCLLLIGFATLPL